MKILFVIDSLGIGGKEKRCFQVAQYLSLIENHEVHILTFDDLFTITQNTTQNIQIYSLKRKHSKDISVFNKLIKILKSYKPDAVISWSLMASFWINLVYVFFRFKYISAYVANCDSPQRFSIGNIARIGSFIFSASIVGNSSIGLTKYKIPKKKACLIYNGYDFANSITVSKEDFKASLNIQTPYVVSMVARISLAKDYQTFINIAKSLIHYRTDITFLAIGGGPLLEFYKTQLNDLQSQFIIFTGERQDIYNFYKITDISVLCSPSEGISNFLLESMANSIPVIATRSGGTPEIVSHAYNGYLVDHKKENDYIYYIQQLIEDVSLRQKLGNNAYQSVKSKFSLDIMGSQFSNLLK